MNNSRGLQGSFHLKAYAKINWDLFILGTRPDGYHNLDSLVAQIDLFDTIEVVVSDGAEVNVQSPVCPGADNLCYKAASLVLERFGQPLRIDIVIDKKIPHGSGLGGGSSDAAAVLKGLNEALGLNLVTSDLIEMGLKIGSDVPCFLFEDWRRMTGRGEFVETLRGPKHDLLLVCPKAPLSTKKIYNLWDWGGSSSDPAELDARFCRPFNDLQDPAEKVLPLIKEIADFLKAGGAKHTSMTGSGSSVFGVFDDKQQAEELRKMVITRFHNHINDCLLTQNLN